MTIAAKENEALKSIRMKNPCIGEFIPLTIEKGEGISHLDDAQKYEILDKSIDDNAKFYKAIIKLGDEKIGEFHTRYVVHFDLHSDEGHSKHIANFSNPLKSFEQNIFSQGGNCMRWDKDYHFCKLVKNDKDYLFKYCDENGNISNDDRFAFPSQLIDFNQEYIKDLSDLKPDSIYVITKSKLYERFNNNEDYLHKYPVEIREYSKKDNTLSHYGLFDIITKPVDIITKPVVDIITKPVDIIIKPVDIITKPVVDIITKPVDIIIKPVDIITKPVDIITKPVVDIITKPVDIITKPVDIITKPVDVITKEANIVLFGKLIGTINHEYGLFRDSTKYQKSEFIFSDTVTKGKGVRITDTDKNCTTNPESKIEPEGKCKPKDECEPEGFLFLAKFKDKSNYPGRDCYDCRDHSYNNYSESKLGEYALGFANNKGCTKIISNTHLDENIDLKHLFESNKGKVILVSPFMLDMHDLWDAIQCATDPVSSGSMFI